MKLPRWTVYPAIAILILMAAIAVPQAGEPTDHEGAALDLRRRQLEAFEARNRAPRAPAGPELHGLDPAELDSDAR